MALRFEQKQAIVAEVKEAAASALSAVLADYRGLTVSEMTELRAKARSSGVYLRVVRNTLAKRALEGTDFACLDEALVGPTMVAFSQEDPGSASMNTSSGTNRWRSKRFRSMECCSARRRLPDWQDFPPGTKVWRC